MADKAMPMGTKFVNPFDLEEDDYEWLELGNIPISVSNPLILPIGMAQPDPVKEMIGLFTSTDYLHFVVRMVLGVELPPYQALVLETLWTKRMPMLIGARGASKSFILAIYCLLRMI